jgi:hypothetical protein
VGENSSWSCSQSAQNNCTWEDDKLQASLLSTIAAHDAAVPLFLLWAAHTVHEPYEVPDADLQKFKAVDVPVRQYYAAMLGHLDGLVPGVVDALKAKGVVFMTPPPATYYDRLEERLPGHGQPTEELRKRGILLDGAPGGGLLLQIFTSTVIGPIFFEIIQRKGNEGFGNGNFQALFESIELDQIRRGVISVDA